MCCMAALLLEKAFLSTGLHGFSPGGGSRCGATADDDAPTEFDIEASVDGADFAAAVRSDNRLI